MHRTRTQQIKEAFRRLSDADPDERSRILESETRDDPGVWRMAQALLTRAEGLPDGFLEPSREVTHAAKRARRLSEQFLELESPTSDLSAETGEPGQQVGRYELVRPLGEGGFGVVWEAEQREPIHRLVALKLVKRGMDTKQIIGRFAAERQSLAVMDHPNISKVLDAGSTEDGRPYFVMELVIGKSIVEFCRDSALPIESKLRIFELVCRAVHHAHCRGIVHRDIKPSNILVTECDGEPTPKIIDFGIAKAMDPSMSSQARLTQERQLVGTPAYMAPEQIDSRWGQVDAKFDIYSLGVLLYELLTGVTPRESGHTSEQSLQSIERKLEEPLPLSRRASRVAKVPVDLDWITLKCLEVERTRRYESAFELAEDVSRWLDGEPVLAGPPDRIYRLRRLCRRHRVLLTSAAALLGVLLLAGTAGFFWSSWKNEQLDSSNAELRVRNEEYLEEKSVAERALEDVERLSDAHLLDSLLARAEEDLWPAIPEKSQRMEAWIAEAEGLLLRLEQHRHELSEVRSRALPEGAPGVEPLRRPVIEQPDFDRLGAGEESSRPPPGEHVFASTETRTWSFSSTKDAWLHWLLEDLVQRLDEFGDPETGALASVRERLAFANDLRKRSLESHAAAWEDTVDTVLHGDLYPGLRGMGFEPQLGLVPLGPDPESGLLEFLDLSTHTGPVLERDAEGRLQLTDDFGIVLVLIPGGTFLMGAQDQDENAPNYDEWATSVEGPVHEETVEAFFLSKFELTQAQWMHLENGANPSFAYAGVYASGRRITKRHPVEQVQWGKGRRVLRRIGMDFPSEAQWEFATRAGTGTAFFFGEDGPLVAEFVNFADVSTREMVMSLRVSDLDDGHAYTSPVGSYRPNPFGLHDVYGNVGEWCSDLFYPNYAAKRPLQEPLDPNVINDTRRRVVRGGSYNLLPVNTRSARRHALQGNAIKFSVGVRPMRRIH